jgi:hypothetical protein
VSLLAPRALARQRPVSFASIYRMLAAMDLTPELAAINARCW